MINIEAAVNNKFPTFANQSPIIRRPTLAFLRKLIREREINQFLLDRPGVTGLDFIDEIFEYFNFSYSVNFDQRRNIPALGRVVIIANHPIGSLDGLALLRLISEIRPDVRILANDMLSNFSALNELIIPLDNMGGSSARKAYKETLKALNNEEAIIVFPAGEVSRAHPKGVRDGKWLPGFLNFARRADAPLLPIRVHAHNSMLFYGASMLFKPLGTALLAREMFNKQSNSIHFSVGAPIPRKALDSKALNDRTLVKRLRAHLYRLGKKRHNPVFETETTIAHPQDRKALQAELKQNELIGETRDGNRIYLARCNKDSTLLKEIGRLRELAFRKVGEGTGRSADTDSFDEHYLHLVLWDHENLEIAGAYRLGEGKKILEEKGLEGFYTASLYHYADEFSAYIEQGIELGRSFVNPKYWGKASLDYLWQGIGAYLARSPNVRYLVGPVSMSADYPKALMDTLAFFYQRYHAANLPLAKAQQPYNIDSQTRVKLEAEFAALDREQAFEFMQSRFSEFELKLPVLFKQYSALFEEGGFQALVFSVDPDFGDCLDGLCMCDISKLKANKAKRYLGTH
ncbi:lysophospholipid acyltransferase family protein [Agaribacterium haliotis]|uniref:lysophospholipid acyltransferase family protein n=1 Tax=Agaribacterium haliotis TaxID=2013869 RepID=UPI000BB52D1E|nr:lysophospholipid acyltransferase family protein [Agaribacterium haliotis]